MKTKTATGLRGGLGTAGGIGNVGVVPLPESAEEASAEEFVIGHAEPAAPESRMRRLAAAVLRGVDDARRRAVEAHAATVAWRLKVACWILMAGVPIGLTVLCVMDLMVTPTILLCVGLGTAAGALVVRRLHAVFVDTATIAIRYSAGLRFAAFATIAAVLYATWNTGEHQVTVALLLLWLAAEALFRHDASAKTEVEIKIEEES